jgi:glycosyltransferase involved in cell wall biosynthesis
VLDIEDLIRFEELARWHRLYQMVRYSGAPDSEFYADRLRRHTDRADAVTVTSRLLAEKYDGTRVPYGPDPEAYAPDRFDHDDELCEQFGDGHYAVFAGTIRPHKGLDVLADAVALAENDVQILVLGYDPENQLPELRERSEGAVEYAGTVPHHEVPRYLHFADVVALPQKDTRYTQAQVPEKLFEAMSMAKPIVASAIADFPEILEGCGRTVPPEDPAALASELDWIVDNPEAAAEMGERARERYVAEYGWDAMEDILEGVLRRATEGA